jgi:hypothetical protein
VTDPDPVFVKSGDYASYTDFWHLVALSGFPVVLAPLADLRREGRTYIFPTLDQDMMACLEACPQGIRKSRAVFWNLERPDANLRPGMDLDATYRQATGEILSWADEIWVSDRQVHALDPRPKFAVLGGHPDLVKIEPGQKKDVDIVHVGQLTDRRKSVLNLLRSHGCRVEDRGAWGYERAQILSRSRLMVGIDRVSTDPKRLHFSTPLRFVVAASARLPVLQEGVMDKDIFDPYPLVAGTSVAVASYGQLPDAALELLNADPPRLAAMGRAAYEVYCRDWTFRRGVLEACGPR